jgi:prevent-host-death family protein
MLAYRIAMQEIGAFEAKNTLGALLDRVEHGEEIVITRRGKPVARLVRAQPEDGPVAARAAAARLRALAKDIVGGPLTWDELKTYRDEGRR